MTALGVQELDAIVADHDLELRAHTAALPIAKAVLRESEHYHALRSDGARGGGSSANEWVRREAGALADVMATAMLEALRGAVDKGLAP